MRLQRPRTTSTDTPLLQTTVVRSVAEMYGEDMTGRRVSEIDNNNYATQLFRAIYRVAALRGEPVFSHHRPPPHVSVTAWKRLILPLANAEGAVCRFLSVNLDRKSTRLNSSH